MAARPRARGSAKGRPHVRHALRTGVPLGRTDRARARRRLLGRGRARGSARVRRARSGAGRSETAMWPASRLARSPRAPRARAHERGGSPANLETTRGRPPPVRNQARGRRRRSSRGRKGRRSGPRRTAGGAIFLDRACPRAPDRRGARRSASRKATRPRRFSRWRPLPTEPRQKKRRCTQHRSTGIDKARVRQGAGQKVER